MRELPDGYRWAPGGLITLPGGGTGTLVGTVPLPTELSSTGLPAIWGPQYAYLAPGAPVIERVTTAMGEGTSQFVTLKMDPGNPAAPLTQQRVTISGYQDLHWYNLTDNLPSQGQPACLPQGTADHNAWLAANGLQGTQVYWRPTTEIAQSAAFQVIVGPTQYTLGGATGHTR
jgi:hypothetical protein